jgi:hypothetical protein
MVLGTILLYDQWISGPVTPHFGVPKSVIMLHINALWVQKF